MRIEVCKAAALHGDDHVEPTQIIVEQELPPDFGSLDTAGDFYQEQATAIADGLKALPQGTYYKLLCLLLERAPIFYKGR